MIAYDLQCSNGHVFEGWFDDLESFEDQKRKKLIACPVCNDTSVMIVPSAFAIKTSPSQPDLPVDKGQPENDLSLSKIIDFVEKNFEDVGAKFAGEALKMHYAVTEKRNIRGTSTKAEEETLEKEGIRFFKLPLPKLDS
jgi:hypothetical protein